MSDETEIPKPPPAAPPKQVVTMNCRAGGNCPGRQAYVVFAKPIALIHGGGTNYRYRCTTCKGVWHLTR